MAFQCPRTLTWLIYVWPGRTPLTLESLIEAGIIWHCLRPPEFRGCDTHFLSLTGSVSSARGYTCGCMSVCRHICAPQIEPGSGGIPCPKPTAWGTLREKIAMARQTAQMCQGCLGLGGFVVLFPFPGMFSPRSDFYSWLFTFYNPILTKNWELIAWRNYTNTDYTLGHIVFNSLIEFN